MQIISAAGSPVAFTILMLLKWGSQVCEIKVMMMKNGKDNKNKQLL